ncbi:MAG: hypothetical protein K0R51_2484 [Cytophagaceae bacterium]|jgi:hypothetical protein|nr:hypothetical protein [Cytophagaceae bacterium]
MKQLPASSDHRIETLLIAGAIVPQLLGFIWGKGMESYWLFTASFVFLVFLSGYYTYTYSASKKILFIVVVAVALITDIILMKQYPLLSARIGARSILGLWMMIFAVQQIIKTKSFEMLTVIAALFLILNSILYFPFLMLENVEMIILFGSTFTLATLVYYENLWDQYDAAEKKVIIVCLLTLLVDVLFFSKGLF